MLETSRSCDLAEARDKRVSARNDVFADRRVDVC
jgi:hypothetical protein